MKTLEERKKSFAELLTLLRLNDKLSEVEANVLHADMQQISDLSFSAGQQAANKAHEQTQEFLNKKI